MISITIWKLSKTIDIGKHLRPLKKLIDVLLCSVARSVYQLQKPERTAADIKHNILLSRLTHIWSSQSKTLCCSYEILFCFTCKQKDFKYFLCDSCWFHHLIFFCIDFQVEPILGNFWWFSNIINLIMTKSPQNRSKAWNALQTSSLVIINHFQFF